MISSSDILKGSILIVDDQEANVALLEQMLSAAGYVSITTTTHPHEVCELYRKNRFAMILLDLQMPGLDGFQVMEGLNAIETEGYLPVLVQTSQPSHRLRALRAGAKDFVSKPFDLAEVLLRVHNLLEVRLLHLESKRLCEQARKVSEKMLHVFRSGPIAASIHTVSGGRIIDVNDEYCRLFGYSRDELIGGRITDSDLWCDPEDRASAMQRLLKEKTVRGLEIKVRRKSGEVRHGLASLESIELAGEVEPLLISMLTDITERNLAEEQLKKTHEQLLVFSRQAGMAEIAINVLHNVGNVLNSVNVSAGLIVESVKNSRVPGLARVAALLQEHAQDLGKFMTSDPHGRHVPAHLARLSEHLAADHDAISGELHTLQRNVEHIKGIVAMQQSYATFGGAKEMIDLVNLVEDSLRMSEGTLIAHHVEIVREFESVPSLNVEKHKILQILVNLLHNAKHAWEPEHPDKRLVVRVTDGADGIEISIIDNGIGIRPENLIRIFSHGFTTRKDGHGFGLHSSALAAKEMGGALSVHSDGPGRGATFTLKLPSPAREASHA